MRFKFMSLVRVIFVSVLPLALTITILAAQDERAPTLVAGASKSRVETTDATLDPAPRRIAPFVQKAIDWLVQVQQADGGWGSGQHTNQQLRDPHQVVTDPGTTAFTAMALMRVGHTPVSGAHQSSVRRATEYLLRAVEESPVEGPLITELTGTQPQIKMGRFIDTAMTTEFLARVVSTLPAEHELRSRVDAALDKCLTKLQGNMLADGTWSGAGWAGVLQSARGFAALEVADAVGARVDPQALERARSAQARHFDAASGVASAREAAGVELYAYSSAQRAVAGRAKAAEDVLEAAKRAGEVSANAEVSPENLQALRGDGDELAQAYVQMQAQNERIDDEALLRGFGSNGGEEFMSYLQTAESLVIAGDDKWGSWNDKMHTRLAKVQRSDGTWSGQHCITSPVFCTATVVQCLTADHDAELLTRIAARVTQGR